MAEVFKPIGTETSVNTTATTVSTTSKLIRLVHTGAAATVSNTITCKTPITFNSNTDVDSTNDFITLTKRINGGTIGLEDRKHHYEIALKVLT